ncbi:MAG TPA: TIGR03086 family metal-binding protein [Acidimicrobiia bacterium]|nr:TIGR03086 family metal-binding protein [Acidimicrobiia bacterium]
MTQLDTLEYSLHELQRSVAALADSQMGTVSNCAPWTVRELASHALNNQLLWAGMVTGEHLVSPEDTMGAVAYEGDLSRFADDVVRQAMALWRTEGVLAQTHVTPLGELPGSIVINFPTIDALAHAWDVAASVGRALEFAPEEMPAITAVVEATCTDAAREHGLIQAVAAVPGDATDTERLMAAAGRTIPR